MKNYLNHRIIDKKNREIILRQPIPSDSLGWHEGAKIVALEKNYLLVEPDTVYSVEVLEKKIKDNKDINNQLIIIAEYKKNLLGVLSVSRKKPLKMNHTCEFGIWIIPEFRNSGIGKEMIVLMEDWAKDVSIKKINLSVFQCNNHAQNTYLNLGYKNIGSRKQQIHIDGVYYDEILMEKII